jgi:O-antigen ligase
MMTIMAALCLVALPQARKQTVLWWAVLILMGPSLLVSLGRNVIVSLLFVLSILILLLRASQRVRFLSNLLALTFVAVAVLSVIQLVAPNTAVLDYPKTLFERFARLTTTDPLSPEETLLWRVKETRYAMEQLLLDPILGIGLETEYRPPFFEGDTLQGYIHNGYLWLWLKTGLAGLLSFLWFFTAFLTRGFRHWKTIRDDFLRPVSLGFTLVIVAMLLSNFIAPLLVSTFSLVFFGVGMGIVEATRAVEQETASQRSAE